MPYELQVEKRTTFGKKVKKLRREGWIPAEVYGQGIDNQSIQINAKTLGRVLHDAGATHLIAIQVGNTAPVQTLARNIQYSPVKRDVLHVDFYAVIMDQVVSVSVPVHVIGASALIDQHKGILVHGVTELEIEALPANLPESIEVDISNLTEFSETITVAELTAPAGVTILANPDVMVITIQAPRTEEELEKLAEPIEMDVDSVQEGVSRDEDEDE